jgi:hypothetical protein
VLGKRKTAIKRKPPTCLVLVLLVAGVRAVVPCAMAPLFFLFCAPRAQAHTALREDGKGQDSHVAVVIGYVDAGKSTATT